MVDRPNDVPASDMPEGLPRVQGDGTNYNQVREGHDARDDETLRRNPSSEDAKLEVALDETFPGSDAPSNTQPGKGKDPAPSSGYDEEAESGAHPS